MGAHSTQECITHKIRVLPVADALVSCPDSPPVLKDPFPHTQGVGGHSFQLSPSPGGAFGLQEPTHLRSQLPLGRYMPKEWLLQGIKFQHPCPTSENCEGPTQFQIFVASASNKLLASKFLSQSLLPREPN